MKKFSIFSTSILLSAVVVVFLIACQKESSVSTDENVATSESTARGISGTGKYAGSINQTYAEALAANYGKKYGGDEKQTQSVAFSANDLISYINGLKAKYKSDIIYVNFGVYGKGAVPPNSKDWGRLTVYFTGNKMGSTTVVGGRKTDGVAADDTSSDDFLNHGAIWP